jgi:hypothetical protein
MITAAYFLEFLWVGARGRAFERGFARLRAMFWVWRNIRYVLRARETVKKMEKTSKVGITFGKFLLRPTQITALK